ncbi:TonB-dependent receptor [Campylobacter sp. CCS1377]|uniref:TonB-dependent receptor n=1 Tax=Campylobacter sp. CCS1377 TaxID=3158229 RepID=A0AAU7E8N8_9BACT
MKHTKYSLALLLTLSALNLNAEDTASIDKVIVSASGFEQDADSNLRNVVVVEGKDLQNKGYTSVEQALQRVSGISFVNFGLGQNIDIRGQGEKSSIAVKVMVDGRAINVLDNSHGVTPLNTINLDNIERIEIIPGGGAVLYGNGTRGGVINIITKKQKNDALSFSVKGDSYDKGNLGGNFNVNLAKKLSEDFSLSLDINSFNRDGYQKGYNEKGYFMNSKAYLDIGDDSDLSFAYNYFESKNTSSGYLTKEQIKQDPTQRGDGDNISKIIRPELSLDFHHALNDNWEFNLGAFWQNQKIHYLKDEIAMMGTTAYQDGSGFEDTLTGINLKSKFSYGENSYLSFGYEFINHDAKRKSLVFYSVPGMITYHRMTTNMTMQKQSHSLFALNSHQINEKFGIFSGVRYEYASYKGDRNYRNEMDMAFPIPGYPKDELTLFSIDKQDTNNFAFEITPNFKYSDTGSIYAKFERGFVSPTPAQFVNKDQTKGYYTANLEPEIFDTFEVGIKDFWWDFYEWNLTLFYTQSKDEISYLGDPHATNGAFWKYYNIDQTKRLGTELSLSQSFLNDTLFLKQSLTYIDAKISKGVNDGLRIPYVSSIKASAGLEYTFNSSLSSFIDLTYYSRAKDGGVIDANTGKMSQNEWIKDHFITDIGGIYRYKNLQILAGIRNLFDKQYYTYQNSASNQYTPARGRNYYMEFKYVF